MIILHLHNPINNKNKQSNKYKLYSISKHQNLNKNLKKNNTNDHKNKNKLNSLICKIPKYKKQVNQ
jgi:hypothetical protein